MKQIINVVLGLFLVVVLLITVSTPVSAQTKPVPILMYHYIGDNPNPTDVTRNRLSTSPKLFAEQMDYLEKHGFTPISLDTLYGIYAGITPSPAKPVVLTFDDGYIDFYLNAYPILKQHNFQATVFIPTGLIGGSYYMNWDQLREMHQSGLISLQSHAVTHKSLSKLSYEQALNELVTSKAKLEKELGGTVNFVAFPSGATSAQVNKAVQVAGYSGGLTTRPGKASSPSVVMPRLKVNGQTNITQFASLMGK